MGKGRCETWQPLPQGAGDAVRHYVTWGRPASDDDHVFLRVYAPIGPLPSSGPIAYLVQRTLQRAAIDAPSKGAHLLRHSAATDLLRQGASLDYRYPDRRLQFPDYRFTTTTLQWVKVPTCNWR